MTRLRIAVSTVGVVAAALLVVGYGLTRQPNHATTSAAEKGRWQLADLEQGGHRSLVSLFNQGVGTPRLVLLVSPT